MIGTAYVFPLEYCIYTDNTSPPTIREIISEGFALRFYPPFRHASSEHLQARYTIDPGRIPFRPQRRPDSAFKVADAVLVIPQIEGQNRIYLPGVVPPEDELPKDCVRLDVAGATDEAIVTKAMTVFRELMALIRWRTKQWWVTRSSEPLYGPGSFSFPITPSGDFAKPRIRDSGTGRAHTLGGGIVALNDTIWRSVIADLQDGTAVPIWDAMLLDAMYFRGEDDIRQSVLQASGACDYLKERTFEKLWLAKNPGKAYDRDDTLRNWDMPRHVDVKFQNHFGRSYKTDHPTEYDLINKLNETRNNVAHGGPAQYGSPPIMVDSKIMLGFIKAAEHCVRWLEKL